MNDPSMQSAKIPPMTWQVVSGKPKLLGSGGRMVAKLKLKGNLKGTIRSGACGLM